MYSVQNSQTCSFGHPVRIKSCTSSLMLAQTHPVQVWLYSSVATPDSVCQALIQRFVCTQGTPQAHALNLATHREKSPQMQWQAVLTTVLRARGAELQAPGTTGCKHSYLLHATTLPAVLHTTSLLQTQVSKRASEQASKSKSPRPKLSLLRVKTMAGQHIT